MRAARWIAVVLFDLLGRARSSRYRRAAPARRADPEQQSGRVCDAADGSVLFSADDGTHGRELWRSDGTAAGTQGVYDPPGDRRGRVPWLSRSAARSCSRHARDGRFSFYATDGTAEGTRTLDVLPDVRPGPEHWRVVGGHLFFGSTTSSGGPTARRPGRPTSKARARSAISSASGPARGRAGRADAGDGRAGGDRGDVLAESTAPERRLAVACTSPRCTGWRAGRPVSATVVHDVPPTTARRKQRARGHRRSGYRLFWAGPRRLRHPALHAGRRARSRRRAPVDRRHLPAR